MSIRHATLNPPDLQEPRRLSPWALALALFFGLLWPVVAGVVTGGALSIFFWDAQYVKWGLLGGVAVGVMLSGTVLTGSWLFTRVMRPTTPTTGAMAQTITYARLGEGDRSDIRIVPLRAERTVDRVPARDLAWFAKGLASRGHTMRAWLGLKAPSGQVVDTLYWKALCGPLRKSGAIVGVGPRKAGRLATTNVDVILAQLGLDPNDPDLWRRGDADEV